MDHKRVRQHYDSHPYPSYPLFLRGDRAQLERVKVVNWNVKRQIKEILVAGCGAVAGFMFAQANPNSKIVGLDLSKKSLRISQWRSLIWGVRNVEYRCKDLLDEKGSFDAIDAYGVLHHTVDPEKSLEHLFSLLLPGGVMRVMLYSSSARKDYEEIRSRLMAQSFKEVDSARRFLKEQSIECFGEMKTHSGLADSVLHPLVHTFDRKDVEALLGRLSGHELLSFEDEGNFVFLIRKVK